MWLPVIYASDALVPGTMRIDNFIYDFLEPLYEWCFPMRNHSHAPAREIDSISYRTARFKCIPIAIRCICTSGS